MHGPCEMIVGYPYRQLNATLHKVPVAEGQAREAAIYFYGTLISNLGNWKKCHKGRFTSFDIHNSTFNISLLKKYYRDQLLFKVVQAKDDTEYKIDLI